MDAEAVSDLLNCAVCGCVMSDPRVLSCQHAFCMRCIFQLVRRDRGAVEIKCPFNCSANTVIEQGKDVRSLPKNHLISSLCDGTRRKLFEKGELNRCDFCDANNEESSDDGDDSSEDDEAASSSDSDSLPELEEVPLRGGGGGGGGDNSIPRAFVPHPSDVPSAAAEQKEREDAADEKRRQMKNKLIRKGKRKEKVELSYCDKCYCVVCDVCMKYSDHSYLCGEGAAKKTSFAPTATPPALQPRSSGDDVPSMQSDTAAESTHASPTNVASPAAQTAGDLPPAATSGTQQQQAARRPAAPIGSNDVFYPFLTIEQDAIDSIKAKLLDERGIKDFAQFTLKKNYIPFHETHAVCKGTHGSAAVEADYDVFTVGGLHKDDPEAKHREKTFSSLEGHFAKEAPPMQDDGLAGIHYAREILNRSTVVLRDVKKMVELVKRRVSFTTSIADLATGRHLATIMQQIVLLERVVLRPTAQRVVVCGNIEGCSAVERLQRSIQVGNGIVKTRLRKRIEVHQALSCKVNQVVSDLIDHLGEVSDEMIKAIKELAQLLREKITTVKTKLRRNGGRQISQKSLLKNDSPQLFSQLHAIVAAVAANANELCAYCEEQCAMSATASSVVSRREVIKAEQASAADAKRLMSSLGSVQHLFVLWSQMVLEGGEKFEGENIHVIPDVSAVDVMDTSLGDIPEIVKKLTPQIASIREQHLAIMRRHPNDTAQHRNLNSQLSQLQEQTIELFQKEHMLQLSSLLETIGSELTRSAKTLFAAYRSSPCGSHFDCEVKKIEAHLEGAADNDQQPRETESVTPPSGEEDATASSPASGDKKKKKKKPSEIVALMMSPLGAHLNKFCRRAGGAAVEIINERVPIARVLMTEGSEAMEDGGRATSSPVGQERSSPLYTPPPLMAKYRHKIHDTDVGALDGTYTDDRKEKANKLAKKCFVADDKTVSNINIVTSVRPGRRFLPFYSGHFMVPNDHTVYVFHFFAQTGEMLMDLPPLRGLPWVKDTAYNAVFSASSFWMVNGALLAGLTLYDKAAVLRLKFPGQ